MLWRNSRSFRQCPNRETMISIRSGSCARRSCHSIENESPTEVKPCRRDSRSISPLMPSKWTRMKKSPVSASPYCWLWTMVHSR